MAEPQADPRLQHPASIPWVRMGQVIPKIIHQVYAYPRAMPDHLAAHLEALRQANPAWEHRLYDMAAMEAFISRHYGPAVLARFRQIDPAYGAARADLFRYLAVYRCGGIYLDVKSTFTRPIDDVIKGDESFVVSHWDNAAGESHAGWGLHAELAHLPRGEIQQWHIIAVAGHPYLRRTIAGVLDRIARYRPWRNHAGWQGVLHLTGPVGYTQDIEPIRALHPHTLVHDHRALGLQYSVFAADHHKQLSAVHYVSLQQPVVRVPGLAGAVVSGYLWARRWKRRLAGKTDAPRVGDHVAADVVQQRHVAEGPAQQRHVIEDPARQGRVIEGPAQQRRVADVPAPQGHVVEVPAQQGRLAEDPAQQGRAAEYPAEQSRSVSPEHRRSASA